MTFYWFVSSLRDWAATVRKWKEFKQETGTWPLLSIVASSVHTMGFVVGGVFLIWYSEERHWATNRFALILVAVSIPYIFVWAWLRDKIYVAEMRQARGQLGDKSESWRSHTKFHSKTKTETFDIPRSLPGNWSKLLSASMKIDNAVFTIFLAFLGAAIIAQALFWLLGW